MARPKNRLRGTPAADAHDEWRQYAESVRETERGVLVGLTRDEAARALEALRQLAQVFPRGNIPQRNARLEKLVLGGQTVLRRIYMAGLLNGRSASPTRDAAFVVELGAAAIRQLGRAPGGPRRPYVRFNIASAPARADDLGIEILSSGAFPDVINEGVQAIRSQDGVRAIGFENVIAGLSETPRTRLLADRIRSDGSPAPLDLPVYLRTMLDLELMRLGQATTPGTLTMLLDSFYRGALFTNHSTNVSEQVQIIYAEEQWGPAVRFDGKGKISERAAAAAKLLFEEWFRFAADSPVGVNHPREARIAFDDRVRPDVVRRYFTALRAALDSYTDPVTGRRRRLAAVHRVVPTLVLGRTENRERTVTSVARELAAAGWHELYLFADWTRERPGILRYFMDPAAANRVLARCKKHEVAVRDGRTIDQVATANKAIEATTGAIQSGQGIVKVGLLGLPFEEMRPFTARVKAGLESRLRTQANQQLAFIGIVDEPLVTEDAVLTEPYHIAERFLDLRRGQAGALLLDTLHKGKGAKRLLAQASDKGGHLTMDQMRCLVQDAREHHTDLWVAGSYTEDQVYLTAKEPADRRPSLICLGGAERSAGGLRLEPRDAFEQPGKGAKAARQKVLVEFHADIKRLLSRDNKLARDAGHVVGELERRRERDRASALEQLRKDYLKARGAALLELEKLGKQAGPAGRNIDAMWDLHAGRRGAPAALATMAVARETYVAAVAEEMGAVFAKAWFSPPPPPAPRRGAAS